MGETIPAPAASSAPVAPSSPVASSTALVLLAAGLVAAALVALGLSGLVQVDDVVATSARSSDRGLAAVPAAPAPAPALAGAVPAVSFARSGDGLPPGLLGPWREVSGRWQVSEGEAAVQPEDRAPAIAVVAPPDGTTIAQVTVVVPRPGAGLVVEHEGADSGLRLVVASSGRAVELVRLVRGAEPVLLGSAPLQAPGDPVVLAIARDGERVKAYGNGELIVSRIDRAPDRTLPVGLVAGPGRSGEAARFDDLVVG